MKPPFTMPGTETGTALMDVLIKEASGRGLPKLSSAFKSSQCAVVAGPLWGQRGRLD